MKDIFVVALTAWHIFSFPVVAQSIGEDVSKYDELRRGGGVLTVDEAYAAEAAYMEALVENGCQNAVGRVGEFARAANATSNVIRQALQPFYSARRDDQNSIGSLISSLADAEEVANSLTAARNRAWVAEAECLYELGRHGDALAKVFQALDYISISERETWERARNLVWTMAGFQSNP